MTPSQPRDAERPRGLLPDGFAGPSARHADRAWATEGTIAAPDAQGDPRTAEFTQSYLLPLGITSLLDVPIWVEGEMIGILSHEHVGEPRAWSLEDEEFAYLMASLVARTLERLRRHHQAAA